MRSIRTRLIVWLVGGTLAVAAAAGVGLYGYMEEALEHGLDAALAAKAEAIAGGVRVGADGRPHLRSPDAAATVAVRHEGPFAFQLWRADGTTLARVAPGDAPLARPVHGRHRFADGRLPDGTSARFTELSFVARADDARPPAAGGPLTLVVAHDRRSIDGTLAVLLTGLSFAAAGLAAGIGAVVAWGVGRGLRPLADVSAVADRIGPDALDVRFPGPDQLPPELAPIGLKLNALLDRLSAGFARERRFSAAVAHELRTPLAELRSACDVALRWPDDHDAAAAAVADARAIADEMGGLVRSLLALARGQAGVDAPRVAAVPLAAAVAAAWAGPAAAAAARGLTLDGPTDDGPFVRADPDLLAAVLRNLLGNAVAHATAGGRVAVRTGPTPAGVELRIGNPCDTLDAADLPRLFEPFWQRSAARTGGDHVGLGLSIVEAHCRAMGVPITASLADGWFELTLVFPAVPPPEGPDAGARPGPCSTPRLAAGPEGGV